MSNYTFPGVLNTFDVLINGDVVGSFDFLSTYANSGLFKYNGPESMSFDLNFTFPLVAGPDFTLSIIATSTVYNNGGSWNWLPGGTVTLTGPAATPLPAALPLFSTGLGALGLLGWRRKRKNAALAAV
jgi:hypothetical protein